MLEQLVISGFGGQGILFIGQLLGYAAALEDRMVTYLPSYGPEMRGGTANCTVTISDGRIMSPLAANPSAAIVMNLPSLDRFEPNLKTNGLLVVNSSMIDRKPHRSDIRIIEVPATHIAEELKNTRLANVVALGCYVRASGVVAPESVVSALPKMLGDDRKELIPLNIKAFRAGLEWRGTNS
ncbi:MAG: 2-oxoacid:ferredoxin oxidoreductase subunit gamma [Chloroflexi bacterium]|nr:MAG: 2-oxoacid:ferredoxin oxidoreductase subunit gamma [Chloroflexota bacterium]